MGRRVSASLEQPRAAERAERIGGRRGTVVAPLISLSSFVQADLDILRSRYDVRPVRCVPLGRALTAVAALRGAAGVFCWFGSVRFLPLVAAARLLGKPVVIVAGGYDVANLPEIRYGNMRPGLSRVLGRWVFRLADAVLPYSRAAAEEAVRHAKVRPSRLRLIYLGFDPRRLGAGPSCGPKEPLVLTVAGVDSSSVRRKGVAAVVRVAKLLPEIRFVVAGRAEPKVLAQLRGVAGPNVTFTGYVSDRALQDLYRRAAVYFQPSVHEAFGCAVAEAMLFDCVPVVTRRFSLPEVVGESGYYVEPEDDAGMAGAIRRALLGPPPGAERPRARIAREFSLDARRAAVLQLLEELYA